MNEAANQNQKYEPTPQQKKLLRLVYIMGIVFVLLFIGLIGGLIWKARKPAAANAIAPAQTELMNALASSSFDPADVRQMALSGDRLALTTSSELVVIDLKSKTIVLRVGRKP